ncbi:MAG: fibronectin type III domain-containing protein [Anaerolineae bacterium]|nr:fibronectin type III domain-containing protein [Anaerolineae bacterium]
MNDHHVYVSLGFHVNLYHSWRGDTPDEAGFGTDIRIMREILRRLDEANAAGLDARGYWDFEIYYSVETLLPRHAPDLLAGIRRRVDAGLDEVLVGPYNNGANHAATEPELRAAVGWALENPFGSGLQQVFSRVAPLYRSQEMMYTGGQNAIFMQEGIQGLLMFYAGTGFNTLGAFTPPLPVARRYNPLWYRSREEDPPILLLPCISTGDLVEQGSLDTLLLKLRQAQVRGEIDEDVLVHLNADADNDIWLPAKLPRGLDWIPNTGGLDEYIRVVNRYDWASFATPWVYAQAHPPQGEVLCRQDLADGAFDGNASWAEKVSSLRTWTLVEQSRLASARAEALAQRLPRRQQRQVQQRLWQGVESPFFRRMVGLSTTHFGMSTPVINEERQERALAVLSGAWEGALALEREVAQATRGRVRGEKGALYTLEVSGGAGAPGVARVPLVLSFDNMRIAIYSSTNHPYYTTQKINQPNHTTSTELHLLFARGGETEHRIHIHADPQPIAAVPTLSKLENYWIVLRYDPVSGVGGLTYAGRPLGGHDFLTPFISYGRGGRARTYQPAPYELLPLDGEQWQGVQRMRMRTTIDLPLRGETCRSTFTYTFTLFDALPYLLVDIEAAYAATPKTEMLETFQQRLRRLIDRQWQEVAPFELRPRLRANPGQPLRVWKHNHLGVTAWYDLDYGQINPRNAELDSFNHQVTAGWVALSDRRQGLLLAENAERLTSMAFCPMRLRLADDGAQQVFMNPFGTYFGHDLDYSHLGGNGIGAALTRAISGSLRSSAPSYNGQTVRFSLMLAPYEGDAPPAELQAAAQAWFHPPAVIYRQTPPGVDVLLPEDMDALIAAGWRELALRDPAPLEPPCSFLANPSDGAVDLVWDEAADPRVSGYEVRWRREGETTWQDERIPPASRHHLAGLSNGQRYAFQVRAVMPGRASEWTMEAWCAPGVVPAKGGFGILQGVPFGALARLVLMTLWEVLVRNLARRRAVGRGEDG